jgi:hypothetical protein
MWIKTWDTAFGPDYSQVSLQMADFSASLHLRNVKLVHLYNQSFLQWGLSRTAGGRSA